MATGLRLPKGMPAALLVTVLRTSIRARLDLAGARADGSTEWRATWAPVTKGIPQQ